MTNAAITPGTQPQIVRIRTIIIEPHPLSRTASGGNKIESNTLQKLIRNKFTINIRIVCLIHFTFVTAFE